MVASGPVIALVDGEHHPAAVRDVLDALEAERGLAGVVFCGGEEKLRPEALRDPAAAYGRDVDFAAAPAESLEALATGTDAAAVVELADEPVLPAEGKLRLAALALHLGLAYEGAGLRLRPPRYERIAFDGPVLAIIGTGKRTGKTAVAGHLAALLRDRGARPAIVSMGRGGPAEPQLATAGTSLDDLLSLSSDGRHAASDYLEDALLAGVPAVGCRRVGGGLAGEPWESNVVEGARLAASLEPGALLLEGSGACVPPVAADRTVCVVGDRAGALGALGPYRLLRADLALVLEGAGGGPGAGADERLAAEVAECCRGAVLRYTLRPEPAEPLPPDARVALFSTGEVPCRGVEPVLSSSALARRAELARDLERAGAERCDVYLTELKAAAVDTVAEAARREGARVAFVRNRPVGLDGDLDAALVKLYEDADA